MKKSKKIKISQKDVLNWDDPKISDLLDKQQDFDITIKDPRFSNPVKRRYKYIQRDEERWKHRISQELKDRSSTCSKLLKVYKASTLSESTYEQKVRPLKNYWSLSPPFEDDCAIITGSGSEITEAFQILGACCFIFQNSRPSNEEKNKIPYVCSLAHALQMQNSFGQSDRIEGISRSYEIRNYYQTLLISEFSLETLSPRIQQALLFLLQDREANGLLTLLHVSEYSPEVLNSSPLLDYFKTRVKIV